MDDLERIYELILQSSGLSKADIKKATKIKAELLQQHIDTLYRYGLVDWEGGKYKAVPEEKIPALYLERNVDIGYLKDAVNMNLVEDLWKRGYYGKEEGDVPQKATATTKEKGIEGKLSELERKIKVLESLQKSLAEAKKIR